MNAEIKTVTVTYTRAARIRCIANKDIPEYGIVAGQRFELVRVRGDQYEAKAVFIDEVEIDHLGNATYRHHNMTGTCYTTILRTNGNHECNCPATVLRCYHVRLLQAYERDEAAALHNRRVEIHKQTSARQVSSIEAGLPAFVKMAMGGRRNGQFSGKAA